MKLKVRSFLILGIVKNQKQTLEKHSKGLEQSTASNAFHIDSGHWYEESTIYVNLLICLFHVLYV